MSPRSKRLDADPDPATAALLDSTTEDAQLARDDILGSVAHVAALHEAGLLEPKEAQTLASALASALEAAEQGHFRLDPQLEDVHFNVEAWLTQRLGDLGKKIHTARSRNDQVALDLRLAARRHLLAEAHLLIELTEALLALGGKAPDAILPGYTHLQPAQPITFAHWTGLHTERILRDLSRLHDAWTRTNVCPLGAAALAGTSHPIDPAKTAHRLGFEATFRNSLDAVSDRDFLVEIASIHAQTAAHLSQLAEDVILYVHPALGFLEIDDAHATGSSIMPQKRNPDLFEVTRAHAATAAGELVTLLTILKALPSAYNRDLQEQKRVAITAWKNHLRLLAALPGAIAGLAPQPEAMKAAAGAHFTDATELADHLVREGVPFRDAHGLVAQLVKNALAEGIELAGISEATLKEVLGPHARNAKNVLGPSAAVEAKTSPGGTAPHRVAEQNQAQAQELGQHAAFFAGQSQRIHDAETKLLAELTALAEVPTR